MSAAHTPGRLTVKPEYNPFGDRHREKDLMAFLGEDGEHILWFGNTEQYDNTAGDEPSHADARRLVACWNACLGMPTEDIEEIADVDRGVMRTVVLAGDLGDEVAKLKALLSRIADHNGYYQLGHELQVDIKAAIKRRLAIDEELAARAGSAA